MSVRSALRLWQAAWPEALAIWSPYTRLAEPHWLFSEEEEKAIGLTGSFAAIRINDHKILISLQQVNQHGLEDYGLEILAHEIGHHVFCPANLLEAGRALSIATQALPTYEKQAAMIVNMWEDLLINDRLVRFHKHRHAEIYERLNSSPPSKSKLWALYMRAFEILWGLTPGRLNQQKLDIAQQGDAHLVARMVRVYGEDWLDGVGGFAALCLPYLTRNGESLAKAYKLHFDTQGMGEGCEVPLGIMDLAGVQILHPSRDPKVVGDTLAGASADGQGQADSEDSEDSGSSLSNGGGLGQNREPFVFNQVIQALGLKLDAHDAAVKFYREKALPHLIPFPTQETEESKEPLIEGLEPWDVGHPMDEVDWLQSVLISPKVIPGVSTVRRTWGVMGGQEKEREPLDLDLYVDCSGSIPNPQRQFSFLTLAGAIVVISALRTGARVQATLWSGARQFDTTNGFIADETKVLRILTGYLGGGTAFPNHVLRETYTSRKVTDRPVHILVLSDEGVDTMAHQDEQKTPGMEISKMALEKARGGGTMVLNLYWDDYLKNAFSTESKKMGWEMFAVKDWSDLLVFAREFAKLKYGKKKAGQA